MNKSLRGKEKHYAHSDYLVALKQACSGSIINIKTALRQKRKGPSFFTVAFPPSSEGKMVARLCFPDSYLFWRKTRRSYRAVMNNKPGPKLLTPAQRAILASTEMGRMAASEKLANLVLKPMHRLEHLIDLMLDNPVAPSVSKSKPNSNLNSTGRSYTHELIHAKCNDPFLCDQAMNTRSSRRAGEMLKLHNELRATDIPIPFCIGTNAGSTMNLISTRGQIPDAFLPTSNEAEEHFHAMNTAVGKSYDSMYIDEMLVLCSLTPKTNGEDLSSHCVDMFLADTLIKRGLCYELLLDPVNKETPLLCRKITLLEDSALRFPGEHKHSEYRSCNRKLTRLITSTLLRNANRQASLILDEAARQERKARLESGPLEEALIASGVRRHLLRGTIIPPNEQHRPHQGTELKTAPPVFVDILNLSGKTSSKSEKVVLTKPLSLTRTSSNPIIAPIRSHQLRLSWPGLHRIAGGSSVAFVIFENTPGGLGNPSPAEALANLCLNARVQNEVYQLILASRVMNSKIDMLVDEGKVSEIKSLLRRHSVQSTSKAQILKQSVAQMCAHNCKGMQVLCVGTERSAPSSEHPRTWAAIKTGSGVTRDMGMYLNQTVIEDATSTAMCSASFGRVVNIQKLFASVLPRDASDCSATTLASSIRVWLGTVLSSLSYMAMLHAVTKQMFALDNMRDAEMFVKRCTYACYLEEGRSVDPKHASVTTMIPSQFCLAFWLPLRQNLDIRKAFTDDMYQSYRPFFEGSTRTGTDRKKPIEVSYKIDKSIVPVMVAAHKALAASLGKRVKEVFGKTLHLTNDFAARYSYLQIQNNGNMSIALCRYASKLQEICETECMTYEISNGMV